MDGYAFTQLSSPLFRKSHHGHLVVHGHLGCMNPRNMLGPTAVGRDCFDYNDDFHQLSLFLVYVVSIPVKVLAAGTFLLAQS
jgi:hypothetical protein